VAERPSYSQPVAHVRQNVSVDLHRHRPVSGLARQPTLHFVRFLVLGKIDLVADSTPHSPVVAEDRIARSVGRPSSWVLHGGPRPYQAPVGAAIAAGVRVSVTPAPFVAPRAAERHCHCRRRPTRLAENTPPLF